MLPRMTPVKPSRFLAAHGEEVGLQIVCPDRIEEFSANEWRLKPDPSVDDTMLAALVFWVPFRNLWDPAR